MSDPSSYRLGELRQALPGTTIHWFPRLGSTNTRGAEMARNGTLRPPAILLTGWQVAGRGRGTNTWWSTAGSLTVTFAYSATPRLLQELPLVAGVCVRRVLAAASGLEQLKLKWPNDLLYDGRKIGGLLCERVHEIDLIGVGLNVNFEIAAAPPLLRNRITSVQALTGRTLEHTSLLIALARELAEEIAAARPLEQIIAEYARHDALAGQPVHVVEPDGTSRSGIAVGLDDTGRLIIRSGRLAHHIIAGHVEAAVR
ncbi:MAG: biotin--[acetyl-CoA-carboxylase] ligase [Phycisphaerae bacterium]|nr:biotin--[acetyl-CoA-carboxylase] ligase [Phycisphaerae bacterium]MDW8263265.1 biotin--[acetyl-CoA-carboxylase] ligase [Phycisphaerales bacterium]